MGIARILALLIRGISEVQLITPPIRMLCLCLIPFGKVDGTLRAWPRRLGWTVI